MSPETDGNSPAMLPPDDAFAVLGNETRMKILHTLGGPAARFRSRTSTTASICVTPANSTTTSIKSKATS